MNNDDWYALVAAVLSAMCFTVFTHGCTKNGIDNHWRDELVRRGHAEYVLDAAHNRQWRWKEQVEKP